MKRKVLITDYAWPSLDVEREVLSALDVDLIVAETGEEDELAGLVPDVDAILTCWKRVSRLVLDAAPRCSIVSRYGVGLDNIDLEAATELGIVVSNVTDYCIDEVSDHTLALLLACARRVPEMSSATSQGAWDLAAAGVMHRLRGQTLTLVGYGNIAREVAKKAQSFGLRVIAYTPRLGEGETEDGVRTTSDLKDALASADYVSLHAPLSAETYGLIDAAALARMKPGAFLINTSRGALIDEAALGLALDDERIAGAALDVLIEEPAAGDHPLLRHPRSIVTPHSAFYSEEAIAELAGNAAQSVVEALSGNVPTRSVPSTVTDTLRLRGGMS